MRNRSDLVASNIRAQAGGSDAGGLAMMSVADTTSNTTADSEDALVDANAQQRAPSAAASSGGAGSGKQRVSFGVDEGV